MNLFVSEKLRSMKIMRIFCALLFASVLAACSPSAIEGGETLSAASKQADGVYGISPVTLQLKYAAKTNYSNLIVYSTLNGAVPLNTNFNTGYIRNLTSNRSYSLKAHGVLPGGATTTNPVGQYNVRTWPEFTAPWSVTANSSVLPTVNGSSFRIAWQYAPWNTLAAGDNAQNGALVTCYFTPDVGLSSNPFASSKVLTGTLNAGYMDVTAGSMGISGAMAIGCEVKFLDGYISRSPDIHSATFIPAVSTCPQSAVTIYDQPYSCTVQDVAGSNIGSGYAIELVTSGTGTTNSCAFLSTTSPGHEGNIYGYATDNDTASTSCNLVYRLVGPAGSSDPIVKVVTVTRRGAVWLTDNVTKTIREISPNDPTLPSSHSIDDLRTNDSYTAHVANEEVKTDKEGFAELYNNGSPFGTYTVDSSTGATNCAAFGTIYFMNNGVRAAGINPKTGEFYFSAQEHVWGTCYVRIFFKDNSVADDSQLVRKTVTITIRGYNDPPEIDAAGSRVVPTGTPGLYTYNCGSKCYVGIDYNLQFQANTGGRNNSNRNNSGEADQKLLVKAGNCYSTNPKLKINYCQLDQGSGQITISFAPEAVPDGSGGDPIAHIQIKVSDNGIPLTDNMRSAYYPETLPLQSCLDGTNACQDTSKYPLTYRDSNVLDVALDISKFNLPLKPALIVSKAACLACHASVDGDIITDFGNSPVGATVAQGGRFRNLFFKFDPSVSTDNGWNSNRASYWLGFRSLNELTGSLYFKKTALTAATTSTDFMNGMFYDPSNTPDGTLQAIPNGLDLLNFLQSRFSFSPAGGRFDPTWVWDTNTSWVSVCPGPTQEITGGPYKSCRYTYSSTNPVIVRDTITPASGPNININYLTISAPLVSDIQKIAEDPTSAANWIDWKVGTPAVGAIYRQPDADEVASGVVQERPFSGLAVSNHAPEATTPTGTDPATIPVPPYVTNKEGVAIKCYGDVVVKGNLFLSSPSFITDTRGCRIHVTGDVIFWGHNNINDGVSPNPGNTVNIGPYSGVANYGVQVTSASSITFGLSLIQLGDELRAVPGSAYNFAKSLGVPEGTECVYPNGSWTKQSGGCPAGSLTLKQFGDGQALPKGLAGWDHGLVSYSHLMINAPVIHSRYMGDFKGSVIADYALFRLGNLRFIFDPVFNGQVPFPRLQTITSTPTSNPRKIFDAGQCNGNSTDAYDCKENSPQ
jgi:hypothetical protein